MALWQQAQPRVQLALHHGGRADPVCAPTACSMCTQGAGLTAPACHRLLIDPSGTGGLLAICHCYLLPTCCGSQPSLPLPAHMPTYNHMLGTHQSPPYLHVRADHWQP